MVRLPALVLILLAAASTAAAQIPSARVTGRVLDAETGEPIAGARVSLGFEGPRPVPPAALPRFPLPAQTNASGVFAVGDVPPGRWRILVQKSGYYSGTPGPPPSLDVLDGRVTTVTIPLARGGAVAGRVLDSRGVPVGDVSVTALQRMPQPDGTARTLGRATEQTNDLGEFRLAGLPPGEYYVAAQPRFLPLAGVPAPSRTTLVQTYYPGVAAMVAATPIVVTRDGTASSIDFPILSAAAYQVSGVAVDASGRPASGARIHLLSVPATLPATLDATALSDGAFRVVNVPEGTYRVRAAMPVVNSSGTGVSTSFRGAGQEIVVQGGDVTGLRVTVAQP